MSLPRFPKPASSLASLLPALGLAASFAAHGQLPDVKPEEAEEALPLYRVELMVFAAPAAGSVEDPRPPLPERLLTWPPETDETLSAGLGPDLLPSDADDPGAAGMPTGELPATGDEAGAGEGIDVGVDEGVDEPGADGEDALEEPFLVIPGELPEDRAFEGAADRVRRMDGYSLLVHEVWVQPGFPRDDARTLTLEELEAARALGLTDTAVPPAPADLAATPSVEPETLGPPRLLDGSVTLYRSRYLHLELALDFSPPDGMGDYQAWHLTESRRMRSNRPHYFDHPRFAAIAVIAPWEPPVPEIPPEVPEVETGVDTDQAPAAPVTAPATR